MKHHFFARYLGVCTLGIATISGACHQAEELSLAPNSDAIGFAVPDSGTTRGTALTTPDLTAFRVFAYATGTKLFAEQPTAPNLMYNQLVSRQGAAWSYSPIKYWSNTPQSKVTFFAYAPATLGSAGSISANTRIGAPELTYTVPQQVADQIDLLIAQPLYDRTKGEGTVVMQFGHALSAIEFAAYTSSTLPATTTVRIERIELQQLLGMGRYVSSWQCDAASATTYTLSGGLLSSATLTTTPQLISQTNGTLMLLPQSLSSAAQLVVTIALTQNGSVQRLQTTVALRPLVNEFLQSKRYRISLQVNTAEIRLGCTVSDWDTRNIELPPFN